MRALAILGLCAACAFGQGVVEVDGVKIVPGQKFDVQPTFEIKNLRWYACKEVATETKCIVVVGSFLSRQPATDIQVRIVIDLVTLSPKGSPADRSKISVLVVRPKVGVPMPFKGIGRVDDSFTPGGNVAVYAVTYTMEAHDPFAEREKAKEK